jgi:hypothetical protein
MKTDVFSIAQLRLRAAGREEFTFLVDEREKSEKRGRYPSDFP